MVGPITVDIDATDLVKFVQNTKKAPERIKFAASKALNTVGDKLVDEVVTVVSEQTGMKENDIRKNIRVKRAQPSSLTFRIDASRALIDAPATRPMKGRNFKKRPDEYFHAQELVKIVTMGDEKVCHICEDLEEGGPYKIEKARMLIPAHPHCRCLVQPYRSKRELPVAFKKGKTAELSLLTMAKLKEELGKQVKITLRATR
jgi:hypothetical protein